IAHMGDFYYDTTAGETAFQTGVVDPLLDPSTLGLPNPYVSAFNASSFGGFGGDAGFLQGQSRVTSLLSDLGPVVPDPPGPVTVHDDTRNFFFLGDGEPDK